MNAGGTVVTTGDGTGLGYNNQMTSLIINGGLLKTSTSDCHIWNITGGVSMTGGELQTNGGVSTRRSTPSNGTGRRSRPTPAPTPPSFPGASICAEKAELTPTGPSPLLTAPRPPTCWSARPSPTATASVGITKSGAGTMVLSGTNTYTGATIVNGGTLAVDGSLAAGSAVAVGGASATGTPTLSGIGTVNGPVTINDASGGAAGTLNPGAVGATGTLTTGAATINGTLTIDINGAALDQLTVNGNLDLTGSSLAVNELAAPTAGPHTIVTYTGTLSGTFASPPSGYTVNYVSGITQHHHPHQIHLRLRHLGRSLRPDHRQRRRRSGWRRPGATSGGIRLRPGSRPAATRSTRSPTSARSAGARAPSATPAARGHRPHLHGLDLR